MFPRKGTSPPRRAVALGGKQLSCLSRRIANECFHIQTFPFDFDFIGHRSIRSSEKAIETFADVGMIRVLSQPLQPIFRCGSNNNFLERVRDTFRQSMSASMHSSFIRDF